MDHPSSPYVSTARSIGPVRPGRKSVRSKTVVAAPRRELVVREIPCSCDQSEVKRRAREVMHATRRLPPTLVAPWVGLPESRAFRVLLRREAVAGSALPDLCRGESLAIESRLRLLIALAGFSGALFRAGLAPALLRPESIHVLDDHAFELRLADLGFEWIKAGAEPATASARRKAKHDDSPLAKGTTPLGAYGALAQTVLESPADATAPTRAAIEQARQRLTESIAAIERLRGARLEEQLALVIDCVRGLDAPVPSTALALVDSPDVLEPMPQPRASATIRWRRPWPVSSGMWSLAAVATVTAITGGVALLTGAGRASGPQSVSAGAPAVGVPSPIEPGDGLDSNPASSRQPTLAIAAAGLVGAQKNTPTPPLATEVAEAPSTPPPTPEPQAVAASPTPIVETPSSVVADPPPLVAGTVTTETGIPPVTPPARIAPLASAADQPDPLEGIDLRSLSTGPMVLARLARQALASGDRGAARLLFEEAIAAWDRKSDAASVEFAVCLEQSAQLEVEEGRLDPAERAWRRSLDVRRETLGSRHATVAAVLARLAQIELWRDHREAASSLILQADDLIASVDPPTDSLAGYVVPLMAAYILLDDTGSSDLARIEQALGRSAAWRGASGQLPAADHLLQEAEAWYLVGILRMAAERYGDAVARFRNGLAALDASNQVHADLRARLMERLGTCMGRRPDRSADDLRQACAVLEQAVALRQNEAAGSPALLRRSIERMLELQVLLGEADPSPSQSQVVTEWRDRYDAMGE
ncbi:MAG: hypothetical protein KDA22_02185 [Phycisphaerales bacterium]|nr:hypothetical protein [Phycisphaerales bacterium]